MWRNASLRCSWVATVLVSINLLNSFSVKDATRQTLKLGSRQPISTEADIDLCHLGGGGLGQGTAGLAPGQGQGQAQTRVQTQTYRPGIQIYKKKIKIIIVSHRNNNNRAVLNSGMTELIQSNRLQ